MANWINIFFGIVCISLIIFSISSFFGITIPNYDGIKKIIRKIDLEKNDGFVEIHPNCTKLGGFDNLSGLHYYEIGLYKMECDKYCSKKSDISKLILVRTKDYGCINNKLYCKCTV